MYSYFLTLWIYFKEIFARKILYICTDRFIAAKTGGWQFGAYTQEWEALGLMSELSPLNYLVTLGK